MITLRDRMLIYAAIDCTYMHMQELFEDERLVSGDNADVAVEFIINAVDAYIQNNTCEFDEDNFDEYIFDSALLAFGKKDIVEDKFMDEPEKGEGNV